MISPVNVTMLIHHDYVMIGRFYCR